jgi:3-deoxy-D-manno-octulosonic-acid transferase
VTELLLFAENLLFPFGALAVVLAFLFSPRRGALKTLRAELPERMGKVDVPEGLPERGRVWVHCASAGEVNAAAALVGRLKARGKSVIVTATTAAGRQRALALKDAAAAGFAPLDFSPAIEAFLERAQPEALLVVETELWPQTLAMVQRREIPVAVVNARMSPRSFTRYRALSWGLRPIMEGVAAVAAQTEADAARYRGLGAPNVVVAGNMKHDLPGAGEASAEVRALFASLGWADAPVFCAGSTHPMEEPAVFGAFRAARTQTPGLKLIVAPRHLERLADCEAGLRAAGLSYSKWSAPEAGKDALLVDTLGSLGQLYALSTVCFVGGTLALVGGHNLLEPALAGRPVLVGPHTDHQAESARLLESAGAGFCAADGGRLTALLKDLLADPQRCAGIGALAKKTAASLQGAVARTEALLAPFLR